jgi:hypothetical protein
MPCPTYFLLTEYRAPSIVSWIALETEKTSWPDRTAPTAPVQREPAGFDEPSVLLGGNADEIGPRLIREGDLIADAHLKFQQISILQGPSRGQRVQDLVIDRGRDACGYPRYPRKQDFTPVR